MEKYIALRLQTLNEKHQDAPRFSIKKYKKNRSKFLKNKLENETQNYLNKIGVRNKVSHNAKFD